MMKVASHNKHRLIGMLMVGASLRTRRGASGRDESQRTDRAADSSATELSQRLAGKRQISTKAQKRHHRRRHRAADVLSAVRPAANCVAKGGSANFAIGWYNVDKNPPTTTRRFYVPVDMRPALIPGREQRHSILFPFSALPQVAADRVLKAASIRMNSAYKNGLIGFVLIPNPNGTGTGNATQYHYTEHRFNVQCTQRDQGPWYFRPRFTSPRSSTIPSTSALRISTSKTPGQRRRQRQRSGLRRLPVPLHRHQLRRRRRAVHHRHQQGPASSASRSATAPRSAARRSCSPPRTWRSATAWTNNCDGQVDEGNLCPVGQICDRGRCTVNRGGEITCPRGLACDNGRCIESSAWA